MIITGENLKDLIHQHEIANENTYDIFSLTLTMDQLVKRYNVPKGEYISYGSPIQNDYIETILLKDGYILHPGDAILACSAEIINMPVGYIGIVQTKGSLARLFISVHCSDGQVESGYHGKVTFEICNLGNIAVKISSGQPIAQIFILETSSVSVLYDGKYNNSKEPTISNFNYNI